jgi:hypothetical protein
MLADKTPAQNTIPFSETHPTTLWHTRFDNMGVWVHHARMKTTLDISDNLFLRAKRLAREEKTTFRNLAEEGLARVLDERERSGPAKIRPVTFKGKGLNPELRGASWGQLRDFAYEGRGS